MHRDLLKTVSTYGTAKARRNISLRTSPRRDQCFYWRWLRPAVSTCSIRREKCRLSFGKFRIAISPAAFDAIAATLPVRSVAHEAEVTEKGERLIWVEASVVDRLVAIRRPGESYSDVILRTGLARLIWVAPLERVEDRDLVAAKMTAAQIAEAQRLAREWKANEVDRRHPHDPHRHHRRRLPRHPLDAARGRAPVARPSFGTANASSTSRRAVLDPLRAVRGPAQAHCDAVGDEDRSDDEEEPVDDSDVENELGD